MSLTHLVQTHSIDTQRVAPFTGEGAYHGSTNKRAVAASAALPPVVEEMRPSTLDGYRLDDPRPIRDFEATFSNLYVVERELALPTQEEVRDDGVTFCWCPFEEAATLAGPLTARVLEAMREHLVGDKRYVYVDSNAYFFLYIYFYVYAYVCLNLKRILLRILLLRRHIFFYFYKYFLLSVYFNV